MNYYPQIENLRLRIKHVWIQLDERVTYVAGEIDIYYRLIHRSQVLVYRSHTYIHVYRTPLYLLLTSYLSLVMMRQHRSFLFINKCPNGPTPFCSAFGLYRAFCINGRGLNGLPTLWAFQSTDFDCSLRFSQKYGSDPLWFPTN